MSGSVSGKKASPKPRASIEGAKVGVELLRDVAGELEMLLLVLADRHVRCPVEQDVGGHQHRIGEQPDRRVLPVLAGLLLELRHAARPAHPGDAVEDPGELGVLVHLALVEDDVLVRVDPGSEERRRHLAGLLAELVRAAPHRDRMGDGVQIDDAIDALMRRLHLDEALDGAEIIAEMQVAGRLNAREHPLLELPHGP